MLEPLRGVPVVLVAAFRPAMERFLALFPMLQSLRLQFPSFEIDLCPKPTPRDEWADTFSKTVLVQSYSCFSSSAGAM